MLKIEIVPWRYPRSPNVELRVEVTPDDGGSIICYNKLLSNDLFTSLWDRMIDEAKDNIKTHYIERRETDGTG